MSQQQDQKQNMFQQQSDNILFGNQSQQQDQQEEVEQPLEEFVDLNQMNICNLHNEEIGEMYCVNCNSINICLQCVCKGIHQQHEIQNMKKAAISTKNKLMNLQMLFSEKKKRYEMLDEQIQNECKNVEEVQQEHLNYINNIFIEIQQTLNAKRTDLLKSVQLDQQQKLSQYESLQQKVQKEIVSLDEHIQNITKNTTVDEEENGKSVVQFYIKNNTNLQNVNKYNLVQDFEQQINFLFSQQSQVILNHKTLLSQIDQLQLEQNFRIHDSNLQFNSFRLQPQIFSRNPQAQSSPIKSNILSNQDDILNNNINKIQATPRDTNNKAINKLEMINNYLYSSGKKIQRKQQANHYVNNVDLNRVMDDKKRQVEQLRADINQQLGHFQQFKVVESQQNQQEEDQQQMMMEKEILAGNSKQLVKETNEFEESVGGGGEDQQRVKKSRSNSSVQHQNQMINQSAHQMIMNQSVQDQKNSFLENSQQQKPFYKTNLTKSYLSLSDFQNKVFSKSKYIRFNGLLGYSQYQNSNEYLSKAVLYSGRQASAQFTKKQDFSLTGSQYQSLIRPLSNNNRDQQENQPTGSSLLQQQQQQGIASMFSASLKKNSDLNNQSKFLKNQQKFQEDLSYLGRQRNTFKARMGMQKDELSTTSNLRSLNNKKIYF